MSKMKFKEKNLLEEASEKTQREMEFVKKGSLQRMYNVYQGFRLNFGNINKMIIFMPLLK